MGIYNLLDGRDRVRAFLLYLLAAAVLYAPVVFGGRTLQPSLYQPQGVMYGWAYGYHGRVPVNTFNVDLATPKYYEWPINRLVGEVYRNGDLPLWNPYQAAGTPLAANYSTRVFFPYQILEDISPLWLWDFFLLGRLVTAGFFSYLFLSTLGLGFTGAFLGGLFYMFSGAFTWFINLEQMANAAMMVPVLLFSIEAFVQRCGPREIALTGICFALVLLAGQPEVALYIILLASCYLLLRALELYGLKGALVPCLKYTGAFALGLALSSPLILLFLEFMHHAHHIHPPDMGMGHDAVTYLRRFFVALTPTVTEIPLSPDILSGMMARSDVSGAPYYFRIFATNGIWDTMGGYTGVVAPFTAFTGAVAGVIKRSRLRRVLLFFLFFGLSIILKNFGIRPFIWLGSLPLFDMVWSQRWAGPVWVFSLSMAGALGWEVLFRSGRELNEGEGGNGGQREIKLKALYLAPYIVYGLFILVFLYAVFPGVVALTVKRTLHFGQLSVSYIVPSLAVGNAVMILILTLAFFITAYHLKNGRGLMATAGLALAELWWDVPRGYDYMWTYLKLIPFAIALVFAYSLFRENRRLAALSGALFFAAFFILDAASPRGFPDRYDPFKEAPYVKFLKQKEGRFRVMGGYGVLFPNYSSALGLEDVRYISALMVADYRSYRINHLQKTFEDEETDSFALWFTGRPERNVKGRIIYRGIEYDIKEKLPYYSMLGVRYIILPVELDLSGGDPLDLPLVYNKEVRIYENRDALPRAFVSYSFSVEPSIEEAQKNFRGDRILLDRDPGTIKPLKTAKPVSEAVIKEYGPNRVVLEAVSQGPGILVLSDVYYPGWEAYVDGVKKEIYRVNGIVRGVPIDKGRHKVVFVYRPAGFRNGLLLSGLALAITGFMISIGSDKRGPVRR